MAPKVYNEKGEKLCKGPLHKNEDGTGTFLPLVRFNFNQSGRYVGKPLYVCRACWRIVKGLDPDEGWVPAEQLEPLYQMLMKYYDTNAALCNDLGIPREYFSRKRKYRHIEVKRKMETLLREKDAERSTGTGMNGRGEAEVVPGEILAKYLKQWEQEFTSERPINSMKTWYGAQEFITPQNLIVEHTGIHLRRVGGIFRAEFQFVPLSQADAILNVTEQWELLGDEIPVIPNPNWSMEKWMEYMQERGCV